MQTIATSTLGLLLLGGYLSVFTSGEASADDFVVAITCFVVASVVVALVSSITRLLKRVIESGAGPYFLTLGALVYASYYLIEHEHYLGHHYGDQALGVLLVGLWLSVGLLAAWHNSVRNSIR